MQTLTRQQICDWATQIARQVDKYYESGESGLFEHDYCVGYDNIFTASVKVDIIIGGSAWDDETGPSWWIDQQKVEVLNVTDYNNILRHDIARELTRQLN